MHDKGRALNVRNLTKYPRHGPKMTACPLPRQRGLTLVELVRKEMCKSRKLGRKFTKQRLVVSSYRR